MGDLNWIVSCPEHGDIYKATGLSQGEQIRASAIVCLNEHVRAPMDGEMVECFCGRALSFRGSFADGLVARVEAQE